MPDFKRGVRVDPRKRLTLRDLPNGTSHVKVYTDSEWPDGALLVVPASLEDEW